MKIIIKNKQYTVIKTLLYWGAGLRTKIVKDENGIYRVVVKQNGKWRFYFKKKGQKNEI